MDFKSYFNLTELGKLKQNELLFSFIIYVFPLFMAINSQKKYMILPIVNQTIYVMLTLITLLILNAWLIYKKLNNKRETPELYKGYLLSMMIFLMGLSIGLLNNLLIGGVFLLIAFFAYLFSTGIVLYYIYNCIYIYVLKKLFPKQGNETKSEEVIKLRSLSEFMDLNTQKLYLSLLILDLFLYFVFVGFIMMIIFKHLDIQGTSIMSNLSDWAKTQDNIFMVFNAIALLSLMLTVNSRTIPKRKRIIADAKNELNKRFNNY
ncbi:hypothetical protein [Cytobacillus sp. IB215665]|uniref:hypothetical protein n=1 Tax=Cytobacillus sp. IB215665 TaxID=3097357 RepID=UPI002A15A671|nr:hypothetical protein [Cytobacillus sp. IB215665]MDX8365238.1 hypothetical protein [Cytobacillus sp. IB215665]